MTTIQYGYGSISLGDVLTELRTADANRGYPISLGDADVRALAGKPSGDISLTDLYGKSAVATLTVTGNNDSGYASSVNSAGSVQAYPSVNIAGGSGTKTIQWSVLSSTASVELLNPNNAQCTVRRSYTKNSTFTAIVYLRCVVSDSTGSVTVDNIVADLNVEGGG